MKDQKAANALGDRGTSDTPIKKQSAQQKRRRVSHVAYGVVLLLIFLTFIAGTRESIFNVDVEKVASITSWSVGTSSGLFGKFLQPELPDLEVTITDVGMLNHNHTFISSNTLSITDVGAVRFRVRNSGLRPSQVWKVEVTLPTRETFIFVSEVQRGLAPKEEKTFLLTFDTLAQKTSAEITVQILYQDEEEIKENNKSTKTISVF